MPQSQSHERVNGTLEETQAQKHANIFIFVDWAHEKGEFQKRNPPYLWHVHSMRQFLFYFLLALHLALFHCFAGTHHIRNCMLVCVCVLTLTAKSCGTSRFASKWQVIVEQIFTFLAYFSTIPFLFCALAFLHALLDSLRAPSKFGILTISQ